MSAPSKALKTSIVIVDDHLIVLDGLRRLIEAEPGWTVLAACRNAADALKIVHGNEVDLLIIDLRMPGMPGIELAKEVKKARPALPIIVLTADLSDHELAEISLCGVAGVILKEEAPATLVRCVRETLEGGHSGQGEAARALRRLHGMDPQRRRTPIMLTPRELEISRLAAEGWRTGDIGARLGISPGTVKIHLHSIYRKLDITTRVELANVVRSGLR